ncbi:hypothetical protein IPJ72_00535 [Candidatus Peregrinibacteria bacterium]|nr:MAG: hypothetical protein IPJ72_00535 [Candidatus Peregrinibacteria bacterium]
MSSNSSSLEGRDYLSHVAQMKYAYQRKDAMQPRDYIDMPGSRFAAWVSSETEGDPNALKDIQTVRVSIVELLQGGRLLVQAADVRKNVSDSLFYNYGQTFVH